MAVASPTRDRIIPLEKPTPAEARALARAYASGMDDTVPSADQRTRLAALRTIEEHSTPNTRAKVRKRVQAELHAELGSSEKAIKRQLHLALVERIGFSPPLYVDKKHVEERHLSAAGANPITSSQGIVMSWKDGKPTTTFSEETQRDAFLEMLIKSEFVAKAGERSEWKSPTGIPFVCLADTPATARTAYPIFFQANYVKETSYSILQNGSLKLTAGRARFLAIQAIKKYDPLKDTLRNKNPIANITDAHVTVDIASQIQHSFYPYNTGIRFVFPRDEFKDLEDFALKASWR